MNLENYDDQEGMKAWLSEQEVQQLLDQFDDTEKRIAVSLAVRCGLRSAEVLDIAPEHVVDTDAGTMLRVWKSAKTGEYRETPVPPNLATTIRTVGDVREGPIDAPLVDATTRTLRRWMDRATSDLLEDTGDDGWQFVGMHDLRRTWATSLRSADVDAMVVCDWGGWDDLQTFLDHYRGTHTPEAQLREREKVDWL
ncbi:tyrosine-type recombinase/integrase [Haloarcula argentinensis]|uniref:Tyrosine-type recombinase/integrase n=1 Tax=Haloarcula argentinensis TaxID=43776 RepID=A0A847URT4_HALAR|nr:tyrosine-type recombinase/integrase [Haloarcula argentinensis]NLV14428.1 tyrosine-type recombinase/integrase [Haloarcula argentinensis]